MRDVWAATHVGRARPNNEDRCAVGAWRSREADESWYGSVSATESWALIADGMGGHEAGEFASEIVIAHVSEALGGAKTSEAIRSLMDAANNLVFESMFAPRGRSGMGSTIVGVRFAEDRTYIFNVGDSRAYLLRGDALYRLSHDDVLEPSGSQLRRRSHALTQSLGGLSRRVPIKPHVRELKISPTDQILLCSDGLSDEVSEDEILGILSRQPRQEPADRLIAAALDAGGNDNISVVVIGIERKASKTERD